MARSVKVGAFQAMQRQQATGQVVEADPFAIDPAAEDAAATARLKEIGCGPIEPAPEPIIEVAADPLADLLHGSDESDYPTVSDLPCDECGGEVMLRSAEEDRLLASRVAEGVEVEVLCDDCAAADGEDEEGPSPEEVASFNAIAEQIANGETPVEPKAEDQAEDQAEVRPGANIHGIGPDTDYGPNPDYDPSADPLATLADHLRGLNVEASCTAEMSLHMITERVRDASLGLPMTYAPTENDVVLEAERIWVSLDRKRSHTYSVEQDGTIRDWRRPDTTPDRGDVTKEHTITDETEEQRFSGAGAEDGQQASMFLVPSDSDFRGKLYRDAPELANIAEKLIGEHGFLEQLENCDVRWYWKRKTGVSKGRVKIGFMKRASDLLGHFSGADFIGWLSATTARDGKFTDRQVEAAVFHQLCHIGSDDSGNWIFAPHDFEGFAAEVRVFGTWTSDLKLGGNAFVAAHQMGLFSDEDDEGEAAEQAYFDAAGEEMERDRARDDGAGVLIHPDGMALTDDEIEAMERHELNDDDMEDEDIASGAAYLVDGQTVDDQRPYADQEPAELQEQRPREPFMADVPADPDGPAPDELGDDL